MPGVLTILQNDGRPVQTLIFDRDRFASAEEAKRWAQEHDFVASKVDTTETSFRLRQRDPAEFDENTFRTIDLSEGVQAVVGELKQTQTSLALGTDDATTLAHKKRKRREKMSQLGEGAPTTWLDLTREGAFHGYVNREGEQVTVEITRDILTELARSVRESEQPVPIDGAQVSAVHETVDEGAADAAGFIMDAETAEDPQGRLHLWGQAELQPDVAARIEARTLLGGSAAFAPGLDPESGEAMHRLHSYALTNKPFIPGLAPHRLGRSGAGEVEPQMIAAGTTPASFLRGIATGVYAMSEPNNQGNSVKAALGELLLSKSTKDLADKLRNAAGGPEAVAGAVGLSADDATPVTQANGRLPTDAQLDAAAKALSLDANELKKLADTQPKPQPDPNPGGAPSSHDESVHAENQVLRQQVEDMGKRLSQMEELEKERAAEKEVSAEMQRLGLNPSEERRKYLVQFTAKHGAEALQGITRAVHQPPQGVALNDENGPTRYADFDTAYSAILAEEKQKEGATPASASKKASERIKKEHPHLIN